MSLLCLILITIQLRLIAQTGIESNSLGVTAPTLPSASETNQTASIDAVQWLLDHKQDRPVEVTLVRPVSIPIVVEGKTIGSITKPAGSSLHMEDLNSHAVVSVLNGVSFSVPIENTNLLELAKTRLQAALALPLQNMATNESATNASALNPVEIINEKLTHSPINSDELLDLYMKYPQQLVSILEKENINLTGKVSKILVRGTENERTDITLSQRGPYKITIFCDLQSPHRIVQINQNPGYHNKFDAMDGQLLFTSYKGERNEYEYHYNRRAIIATKSYHEDAASNTKLVCAERSTINTIGVRIKSSNGFNLVFEATSPIQ